MAFNVDKCKVMHIGRGNLQNKYFMNNKELEKMHKEKDLGIYVTDDTQSNAYMLIRKLTGH